MAHGLPDWSESAPINTMASMTDMAELAARLGSIDIYDRRGNVILVDDFTGGIQPIQFLSSGNGEALSYSTLYRRSGTGCALATIVGVAGSYSNLSMSAPLQAITRCGAEASVGMDASISELLFTLMITGSAGLAIVQIVISTVTGFVALRVPLMDDFNLQPITDLVFNPGAFNTLKLVCDPALSHPVRFLLNGKHFDLSVYPMVSVFAGDPQYVALYVEGDGDGINPSLFTLDDVILTINEP